MLLVDVRTCRRSWVEDGVPRLAVRGLSAVLRACTDVGVVDDVPAPAHGGRDGGSPRRTGARGPLPSCASRPDVDVAARRLVVDPPEGCSRKSGDEP
jgi:hypothetical protein